MLPGIGPPAKPKRMWPPRMPPPNGPKPWSPLFTRFVIRVFRFAINASACCWVSSFFVTAWLIRVVASFTSVLINVCRSTFCAVAICLIDMPFARSAFNCAGVRLSAFASASIDAPRIGAANFGPNCAPGPGALPNAGGCGHGWFTILLFWSCDAASMAAITVSILTFCAAATSAIVVLPSLNF